MLFRPPLLGLPALLTAQLVATALLILAQSSGGILGGATVTPVACALLLVFGLPHGTLDLELLRRRDDDGPGLIVLLLAYLACGAAMYAVWQASPLLALAVFLAVAVEHFAEDWRDVGSRFVAYGTAAAMVATPALGHRAELAAIFVSLTGSAAAARFGDILLLIAPIAGVVAIANCAMLWQGGRRDRAVALAAALIAEAVLPPVVGFALFFGFVHSPYQLRGGLRQLQWPTRDAWVRIIVPLTGAALVLAAFIGAVDLSISLDAGALRASFVTLSVLTIPHMLVPYAVGRYRAATAKSRPRHARGASFVGRA